MSALTSAVRAFLQDYAQRHQNPWNRVCHVIGGPLAPVLFLYLLVRGKFLAAGAAFVAGYGLQWLGHHIEGNEVGEWILLKKLARRVSRMIGGTGAQRASGEGDQGR